MFEGFVSFLNKWLPIILKFSVISFCASLIVNIVTFTIYHFYYGGMYVLSHFVTLITMNIFHTAFFSFVFLVIYRFIFTNND